MMLRRSTAYRTEGDNPATSSKMATRIFCAFAFALVISLICRSASAVCPNSVGSEQALWNEHNCRPEFRQWFRNTFNLKKQDWDNGWGWDQCDPKFAFPKMMNSAYLLTYGLEDGSPGPWHGNEDYYTWASGRRHHFRYKPVDTGGAYAETFADMRFNEFGQFGLVHRAETNCPLFTISSGFRAGTMLHESTHVIYWMWNHRPNNPGSNCSTHCSDDWFFHALDNYEYGQLSGHTHSMNQIEIEYLCDLSEFPAPWVPQGAALVAGAAANSRMNNRVLNPPGWICGEPRPLLMPPPPSVP